MSLSLDKNDIANKVRKASSFSELEEIRIKYIGKKIYKMNWLNIN